MRASTRCGAWFATSTTGRCSVIADAFGGMRLNSPNDVAPHPDGSYWFTDPPAGFQLYEGAPEPEGPGSPVGQLRSRVGQLAGVGMWKREIPTANVYRADASGKVDMVVKQTDLPGNPNGILFSPDYKRLYIIANGGLVSCDLDGTRVGSPKEFCDFMVDGVKCRTDGARADVRGNVWAGTRINEGRDMNFAGVTVWSPEGKLIGRDPLAGDLRERRLRRPEAQPAVHDRRPIALRGLHGDAGSITGLDPKPAAGSGQLAVGGSGDPPSQNPTIRRAGRTLLSVMTARCQLPAAGLLDAPVAACRECGQRRARLRHTRARGLRSRDRARAAS